MLDTETIASNIAQSLLRIQAVTLNPKEPFTWTSGIKSPIYCDNRLTISYPEIRESIAENFASLIHQYYPETEVIAGAATGGIPHAALVADRLRLPMVYVRSKPKGHGQGRLIEGVLKEGQKVVVIEDLISTGGSSLKVAQAVHEAGGHPLAVAAIFTYEFESAKQNFEEAGIELRTLSNYSTLIQEAVKNGFVEQSDLKLLQAWKESPETYGS